MTFQRESDQEKKRNKQKRLKKTIVIFWLTSGIAYTKLPIGFNVPPSPPDSPVVVVDKKTIVEVARKVRWMCRVV